MENQRIILYFVLAFLLFFSYPHRVISHRNIASIEDFDDSMLQTYIIQVRPPPEKFTHDLGNWYRSFLPKTAANSNESRMVHIYSEAIIGFAARLTIVEVNEMARKDGFLKAYQDRSLPLLTTHTPTFLGLHEGEGLWNNSRFGQGVVIGLLDTGILPGHPSFHDRGMPAPPTKWKGVCAFNGTGCNKKVIGARTFNNATAGPVDAAGHGTHTASTAAGNFVKQANVLGNGDGTAAGMAPRAHLAIYQVCGPWGTCRTSDIVAGMDAAISDGVDVLSLSIGGKVRSFYDDVIAIGAFSAIEKGIFVSCAAGNSGPRLGTVDNDSPWILTVGASTMDRNIRATVKLGDGNEIDGESGFQPHNFSSTILPLVYPATPPGGFLGNCDGGFNGTDVKGKVVLCNGGFSSGRTIGNIVKKAGGAAMILVNQETEGYTTFADVYDLPASGVSYDGGLNIKLYVNSTENATASIVFKGTVTGISPAPTVAFFSSRGPSRITPGILKPDIIGPGVNVLAAWPFQVGPPSRDHSKMTFNFLSGTSMATPHLSGIAALVKGEHPNWSPAAIKSAIMTTSEILGNDGDPIKDEQLRPASFFVMGAGHVNPSRAADPGLIYDLGVKDYISYLCGLGYTDNQVEIVTRHNVNCATIKNITEAELNYPSIVVHLGLNQITLNRTVTNVGEASTTYSARVDMPVGVSVSVNPETLQFNEVNQKKSFTVSMTWNESEMSHVEGNLEWVSDKHVVRTPIVIS